jgi:chemotaxis protein methyltransferase CheR
MDPVQPIPPSGGGSSGPGSPGDPNDDDSGPHVVPAIRRRTAEDEELEDLELSLLTEAVYRRYGLDFRNYALASLRRRVRLAMEEEGARTLSGLTEKLLHDPPSMERLLLRLSINVTAAFRDPLFWHAVRTTLLPHLRSYPFVRIWHAGCSTGEEVYSMAILLTEEGLYDRCRIYATDMNAVA